jgi:hypothetical protein
VGGPGPGRAAIGASLGTVSNNISNLAPAYPHYYTRGRSDRTRWAHALLRTPVQRGASCVSRFEVISFVINELVAKRTKLQTRGASVWRKCCVTLTQLNAVDRFRRLERPSHLAVPIPYETTRFEQPSMGYTIQVAPLRQRRALMRYTHRTGGLLSSSVSLMK